VIPGNDDAIRSVGLMCRVIADAVIDGRGGLPNVPEVAASEAPVPVVADREPAVEAAAEDSPVESVVEAEVAAESTEAEVAEAVVEDAPEAETEAEASAE
jgi:small subunit ribosomal protein S2